MEDERITDNLCIDYNEGIIYLTNDFEFQSLLFYMSYNGSIVSYYHKKAYEPSEKVYYYIFYGDDAKKAREAIIKYTELRFKNKPNNMRLYFKQREVSQSANGVFLPETIEMQETYIKNLPDSLKQSDDIFVLAYRYNYLVCFCCGELGMEDRDYSSMCEKCYSEGLVWTSEEYDRYVNLVYHECEKRNIPYMKYHHNISNIHKIIDSIIDKKQTTKIEKTWIRR